MRRQVVRWSRTGPSAVVTARDLELEVTAGEDLHDPALLDELRAWVARPLDVVVPLAGALDGDWSTARPSETTFDLLLASLRPVGWYAVEEAIP